MVLFDFYLIEYIIYCHLNWYFNRSPCLSPFFHKNEFLNSVLLENVLLKYKEEFWIYMWHYFIKVFVIEIISKYCLRIYFFSKYEPQTGAKIMIYIISHFLTQYSPRFDNRYFQKKNYLIYSFSITYSRDKIFWI